MPFNLSTFDASLNLNAISATMQSIPSIQTPAVNNPMMFNNNLNFNYNNSVPLNPINSPINNSMPTFNLLEKNFQPVTSHNQNFNLNIGPSMKQIFKNDEITVYVSLNMSNDKTQVNGSFYVSNNVSKFLNNVKLNLSVKKHIICKILSTSATSLEPLKSLGIKKVK
jgi:hypothetical protein